MDYSKLYRQAAAAYSLLPQLLTPGRALPPLQIYVEVTYQCNLRCRFCQFLNPPPDGAERAATGRPRSNPRPELSNAQWRRILAQAPRSALVSFSGGEPFARAGFIELAEATARRNKVHIYTNATRIDPETAARLIALGPGSLVGSGLVLVDVSLEGLAATHDRIVGCRNAFHRTTAAVKHLVAERSRRHRRYPLIELKVVITRDNLLQLTELFGLAEALGADLFNIMALNTLPHAGRSAAGGGDAGADPLRPPPAVVEVDPDLLGRELQRLERAAAGSPTRIRTTPQGFGMEEMVRYYRGDLPANRYRCHFPWYAFGITAFGDAVICPYALLGPIDPAAPWALVNSGKARAFRNLLRQHQLLPGCLGCCMMVPKT